MFLRSILQPWRIKTAITRYFFLLLFMCIIPAKIANAAMVEKTHIGPQIVSALPIEGLEAGRHHFYLQAGWTNTGQPYTIPIVILQGEKAGKNTKRLLLNAGTHGDELNGLRVLHRLASEINTKDFSGQIVMITGLNQPGMRANSRYFVGASGGGFKADLNRNFPGKGAGGSTEEKYLNDIWLGGGFDKFDAVIDMHTQTRGTKYPLFVFVDYRNKKAKEMAFALMPDVIKDDEGEEGTLETVMVAKNIPAVTLEIGGPKQFQNTLIDRAVLGVQNVLRLLEMVDQPVMKPFKAPITGTRYSNVKANIGGVSVIKVDLLQKVKKGQIVAEQYNPFGELVEIYKAPHNGIILAVATDPLREAGSMLVRILR